jgi:hypothetical protein
MIVFDMTDGITSNYPIIISFKYFSQFWQTYLLLLLLSSQLFVYDNVDMSQII